MTLEKLPSCVCGAATFRAVTQSGKIIRLNWHATDTGIYAATGAELRVDTIPLPQVTHLDGTSLEQLVTRRPIRYDAHDCTPATIPTEAVGS